MRPEKNPSRLLSDLVDLLGPAVLAEYGGPVDDARAVRGITHDSRRVRPGDVYLALGGSRFHGAEFCDAAADAGAVAVLTDPDGHDRAAKTGLPVIVVADPRRHMGRVASWIYDDPVSELNLIGITGTSGKTTVAYLVEAGLRAAGLTTGLVGTVEIRVGDERVDSSLTTPEATDLHALFALMRERGVSAAAMEVSSHALALDRVSGARYEVAVFTNLSQDHLDFHADLREYFDTKARLFTSEFSRIAVVNLDDRFGRALVDKVAAAGEVPLTTFSADGDPDADWRATDVRLGSDGSSFRVVGPGGIEADASVALPGPFNVANALAAIVGLVEAGIGLSSAVAGVAALTGVPGRMERVDAGQDFTAVVDYSHKPGAIEAVLTALRRITANRLTIVVGCGGDRDRAKRPLMGEAAARLADSVILTDDNPRSEDPLEILRAMMSGAAQVPRERRARVTVEPDRAEAIALAVARAEPGDCIVIAGKGHEGGQYVRGEVLPFDDREVLRAALEHRAGGG
ncbi:UDP-N-acetylmuramoyl-L-alanyl-D-glutamate--2,6-diaminopimelate ligase [Allonocardiopsis opalescens]|uniref:UDP-N-acetylmuramoyl-L-alanyl-D-glutamate--2,6-diaminopimelate ligase n=1 Tax=Allonocardiopsis opalescens TaxID=1144618 RepID=A0A2T0Q3V3_9ACTN|nr:UDP-N-acetylmuramoyl-L-alanyl-D-glutamate--2,6-diaminopimelate ligase [Allonocardiopsis opalescens]PRX98484.1 UDP-N-acetylmuramoylalanyl-D-glutamate--2,6-diaminopimelate ligase [Allonocardiopsis opalescens]